MARLHKSFKAQRRARRIQRTFVRWFAENSQRFEVPVRVIRRTVKKIDLVFEGVTSMISVHLNIDEISVYAEWGGRYSDILADFDAYPSHVPGGYVCKLCDPEDREVFQSLEAFWRDHIFERFLSWVNSKFAGARWLHLLDTECGSTGASLYTDEQLTSVLAADQCSLGGLMNLNGDPVIDQQQGSYRIRVYPLFDARCKYSI